MRACVRACVLSNSTRACVRACMRPCVPDRIFVYETMTFPHWSFNCVHIHNEFV